MAYTLAWATSPVPTIPDPAGATHQPRLPDRREHFGTEEAALRRARELLPGSSWLDLRLYGPDGRLIATQGAIAARAGVDNPGLDDPTLDNHGEQAAFSPERKEDPT